MNEDYYSLISILKLDTNDNPTYIETLIHSSNVILKGKLDRMEPSLILK